MTEPKDVTPAEALQILEAAQKLHADLERLAATLSIQSEDETKEWKSAIGREDMWKRAKRLETWCWKGEGGTLLLDVEDAVNALANPAVPGWRGDS